MFIPKSTKYIVEAYCNNELIARQYHTDYCKALQLLQEVNDTEEWHANIVELEATA